MQNMPIGIFRGDDTDAFSYQTIVGTIKTDLDLTGCKAVFRYLGFSLEFDPIPEDKKLTIVIPADETKKFPPGLGYASLRVYDSEGRLKTFSNRIMVFVATKTPMFGSDKFEVDFNVRASLEPLKFFVGPNPNDFDEYRGYVEKVIDRASAEKYGLSILLDAIDSDLGSNDGVAATPVAVKAAYAAIIEKLTDDYYTAEQTNEAIDRVAAYYITYDAAGNPFPTYTALANAQTVYSGGKVRTPTRNDYCVVLADEMHDNAEYRYIYAVAEGQTAGSWQPQFPVEGVMTVDQTVTKNSQNPVSGGGVWAALWGTASTAFTSLYDWVVDQLAGKAAKADATLTERRYSEWNILHTPLTAEQKAAFYDEDPTAAENDYAVTIRDTYLYVGGYWAASIVISGDGLSATYNAGSGEAGTIWGPEGTAVATRTALQGYTLGSQTDKPLASEAEAEALRAGKADKSDVDPLLFARYYPDGNVKSSAEFTAGIKYDAPDTTNRTITVKPFCNTGDSENDNSNLVGRVVIPPFVDGDGNGYISDDGTRYKVVAMSDGLGFFSDNPNLTAIFAPSTVTTIGRNVFAYCISLVSASLPAATSIEAYAFNGCTSLAFVDFGDTPRSPVPTLGTDAFYNVPTSCKIIVPYTQYDAWIAADGWRDLPQEFVRHPEKADKPATFTTGNLAALDANGNPTDSGIAPGNKLDSTSAAPAFSSDSSVSYPAGSHVTYNGKLYVCTTATTGGTWVAASWTEDTMTDPDATLDITAQNQLRVVAKDGTLLWAQGYDLASTSSATLACDATNNFTFADGATTQAFTLPTAPTGKVGDFGLDIDNSANTGAATMTLTGLDTAFSVVVPEGENLNDMLAIAAGELARFYVTLTTFRVNSLPTWHIVKQVVENGGATV